MQSVKLIWVTPDAEEMIVKMARVSAPKNQDNMETAPKLLRYLIKHKHISPFEMANMCTEINTTRAIAAQILRHRSFSFQEFSQRYANINEIGQAVVPHLRRQDTKNRQNSIDDLDPAEHVLIDLRTRREIKRNGEVEGAVPIPVDSLREKLDELEKDKTYILFCAVGMRGYVAYRILSQTGFKAKNFSGGFEIYKSIKTKRTEK